VWEGVMSCKYCDDNKTFIDNVTGERYKFCPMCGDKLVKEGINIQHMVLSEEDYNKLVEKYGEDVVEKNIEGLKNYSKAKKYKSAYLTLNKWCKRDAKAKDNGWGDVE